MTIFLTLGQVTFADFEIPERINFGGDQSLSVKQLVGGQRIIDAMGRIDDDISWSGMFFESVATQRAQFLDQMRSSGNVFNLSFAQFNFSVIIRSFKASFERTYQIPYSISCTVIQNLNLPLNVLVPAQYNDAIMNQLTQANDLALLIKNANISSAMALVTAAINSVPSLQNSSPSQLAPIVSSIMSAQSVVNASILTTQTGVFG